MICKIEPSIPNRTQKPLLLISAMVSRKLGGRDQSEGRDDGSLGGCMDDEVSLKSSRHSASQSIANLWTEMMILSLRPKNEINSRIVAILLRQMHAGPLTPPYAARFLIPHSRPHASYPEEPPISLVQVKPNRSAILFLKSRLHRTAIAKLPLNPSPS